MAITQILEDTGFQATEVAINPGENIQCCRVQDSLEADANALWFFEPSVELENHELAGKLIDHTMMASAPVILRFNTSAAILPIVQDLMIIYGNLVKAGL